MKIMSKKTLWGITVTLMTTVLLLGVFLLPASAAVSLKNATLTISSTSYTYTGKAIKPTVTVKVNNKTVSSKNYTVTYANNKAVGKGTLTVKGKGSYTGSKSKSFYITPQKVGSLKATCYSAKIKLTWGKVTGATGYQVFQYKGGKWTKLKNLTTTSYTISGLNSATKYYFKVRAYAKCGSKYLYSPSCTSINAITAMGKVYGLTASSVAKSTATVKWSKTARADSYRVYLTNEETGTTKAYNTTAISYTFTSLSADTQYSVRVRAYNKSTNKYGSNSDYLYFNTAPADVTGFTAKANGTSVALSWNRVSGATGYEIQICTFDSQGKEGEYTKIATTTAAAYTAANLTPYESYGFRIRAYSTSEVTAYGDFVKSGMVKAELSKLQNLAVRDKTNKSISLSWNPVSGATGYKIYINGSFTDAIGSATVYTAEGLSESTTYTFGVSAYYKDAAGELHEGEAATVSGTTDSNEIQKIEFTSKPTIMSIDETATVSVRVLPEYAANKTVTYKSSDPSVATISSTGVITALKTGQTTITAFSYDGKKTASFNLTVRNIISTSISVPSTMTIYLNEISMIVPTFKPENTTNQNFTVTGTDYTYSYKSTSFFGSSTKTDTCKLSDYIYITSDGLVKGLKITTEPQTGKEFAFTLTVRAADSGKTANVRVYVKERKMKLSYDGDGSPWYYGNSAQLSVELGVSISSKYTADSIRYKSSNTSVATVNSKGVVSCVGSGNATITAYTSDNAYSDSYDIYVRSVVSASKDFFEGCKVGSTYQINASLLPKGTDDTLVYRLADSGTDVISLNTATGAVKFLKEGSAAVVVSSKGGMANTKQIWFTSKTTTVPSNSLSKSSLMAVMKEKADSVKSASSLPGYYRSDATAFDNFSVTEKSTSGIIKEEDLMDMFKSFSAPRSTQQAPGGDWKTFNANIPVSGQMMTIVDGLDPSEVKSIKVNDKGSYTYDIVMTLESEDFATLPTNSVHSAHGKVFDILTNAYLADAISEINNSSSGVKISYNAFTQRYHDCTMTVTVNKITGNVTGITYDMSVDVSIKSLKMEMKSGFLSYTYDADMSFSCNNVVDIDFYGYKD